MGKEISNTNIVNISNIANIKTQTINGSKVEIMGTCGGNHVLVKVLGRNNLAQVDAVDLILPTDELPKELAELKFHVKVEVKVEVEEKVEEKT